MDLTLTEAEQAFADLVDQFVDRELPRERVRRMEEEQQFDEAIWDLWAELGWLGLPFPPEYGGAGAGPGFLVLLAQGLARRGYDVALNCLVPLFCGLTVLRHGSPAQHRQVISALVRGEVRLCIAITEPDAGSDAAAVQCAGRVEGGHLVLDGHKVFCSGAHRPNSLILVACRTDPHAANRRARISVALVPNTAPGLTVRPMRTMGRHIFGTNELLLDGVRVPLDSVVGGLHGGWRVLTTGLETERLVIAAAYVGNAQTVVDEAMAYARTRQQFGQPIGKFQSIAHMLVDMQVDVDAARLLTYRAAALLARGQRCVREVSMAKLASSETLARVANQAMQVFGGYGYTREYDIERYFRAARVTTVVGGSSQIQRNLIARELGL